MPAVSVILPVYNAACYLEQCLGSLLGQHLFDIEIICVNDASTDDSLAILKNYACKDSRISVINLEVNRGAGPARNIGMEQAKGNYLAFCDPDDMYPDRALEVLYAHITASGARACAGNIAAMDESLQYRLGLYPPAVAAQISTTRLVNLLEFPPLWLPFYHQRFLFEAAFLREHAIRYPGFRRGQDPPFLAEALCRAGKVMVCPDIVYLYRVKQTVNPLPSLERVKDFTAHIRATYDIFMRHGAQKQAFLYLLLMAQTRLAFRNLFSASPAMRREYIRFFLDMLMPLKEIIFVENYAPYLLEVERVRNTLDSLHHGYHYFLAAKVLEKFKKIFRR